MTERCRFCDRYWWRYPSSPRRFWSRRSLPCLAVPSKESAVRYFGVKAIGAIRGSAFAVTVAVAALGPVIVGLAYEWIGGYEAAIVMLVLPLTVAAGAAAAESRQTLSSSIADSVSLWHTEPGSPYRSPYIGPVSCVSCVSW